MSDKPKRKKVVKVHFSKPKMSKIEKASVGSKDLVDVYGDKPKEDKFASTIEESNKKAEEAKKKGYTAFG
jgi:hypothetical protein